MQRYDGKKTETVIKITRVSRPTGKYERKERDKTKGKRDRNVVVTNSEQTNGDVLLGKVYFLKKSCARDSVAARGSLACPGLIPSGTK